MKEKLRIPLLVFTDLLILGASLCLFALFHHVLPHTVGNRYGKTSGGETVLFDFPGKFTPGAVEQGEEGGVRYYRDESLDLTLTHVEEDGLTYTVADFYLKDLSRFRTAFAGGEFTTGEADSTLNMALENRAILAASGDYCGIRQRSVVIRNGLVYRKTKAHQVCVLYRSGVMETYSFAAFDVDRAIAGGAWQAWDFGPGLLDAEGKAMESFDTGISGPNPRMAIGYFEPGHYCLVAVDGRQSFSRGMTLVELAGLMEHLGCRAAYNLDGGHSAVMTWGDEICNAPSKPGGRDISDILYLSPLEES